MPPEQRATLNTKQLTLALDLTQEQQAEIQKVYMERSQITISRRDEMKNSKDSIPLSLEERLKKKDEQLDRMIAEKNKIQEILSKEQYGKWEKLHANKRHHRQKGKRHAGRKKHRHS